MVAVLLSKQTQEFPIPGQPTSGVETPPCSRCVCGRVTQACGREVYELQIGSQTHRFGMLDRECRLTAPARMPSDKGSYQTGDANE